MLTLTTPSPVDSLRHARPLCEQTFCNPLPVDLADPHVLRVGDVYHLYATSHPSHGYAAWTSTDLVNWQPRGVVYRKSSGSWGRNHFWAPCVVAHKGAYFMFYNCVGRVNRRGRLSHRICVAMSHSPLGPFVEHAAPLWDPGYAVIDAHVLSDDDGRLWLYYSRDISEHHASEVYVVELAGNMMSVIGKPRRCLTPDQAWEGSQWNEAPFVMKTPADAWTPSAAYMMTYSARCFSDPRYSVGYATAPTPLGPWTKHPAPLLARSPDTSGPGHNCIIESPDGAELFMVYHAHKRPTGGHARHLCIDRLHVHPTDTGPRLSTPGPTHTPQPIPSGARATV